MAQHLSNSPSPKIALIIGVKFLNNLIRHLGLNSLSFSIRLYYRVNQCGMEIAQPHIQNIPLGTESTATERGGVGRN